MRQDSTQTEPSHRFRRPCRELIALNQLRDDTARFPDIFIKAWLDANRFPGARRSRGSTNWRVWTTSCWLMEGRGVGVEGEAWERLTAFLLRRRGFASSRDEAVQMYWLLYRTCLFMFRGGAGAECLLEPEDPRRCVHGRVYWLVNWLAVKDVAHAL